MVVAPRSLLGATLLGAALLGSPGLAAAGPAAADAQFLAENRAAMDAISGRPR